MRYFAQKGWDGMERFMTAGKQFFSWICGIVDVWFGALNTRNTAIVVLCLLLISLVLLIMLIVRHRKYRDALAQINAQKGDIVAAKRNAQAMINEGLAEQQARERDMVEQIRQREQQSAQMIADKEAAFAQKNDELLLLRQFHQHYKSVDDAHEAGKVILYDAHNYADEIKLRADSEYMKTIAHAQEEAGAIRDMAQSMMERSSQMLKKALERSHEIIDDAKREAILPPSIQEAPAKMLQDDDSPHGIALHFDNEDTDPM